MPKCPPLCGVETAAADPLILVVAGLALAVMIGVALWRRFH
jgi:MYXO-CTERM domain-containing protein